MSESVTTDQDDRLEDYATSRVPEHRTMGGFRIGAVNGGLVFAVPGIVTGIELGGALGLRDSVYAFLVGGLVLAVLGTITGIVGMRNRLTSCMTMKFVFGRHGANLLAFMFVVALMGWYGVNMDLFSAALQEISDQLFGVRPSSWSLEISAGVLITLSAFAGFRVLERLATLFVPVMAVLVLYMLYASLNFEQDPAAQLVTSDLSFGESVSIVIGSFIVSVVLMPDFTRFARTATDATIGSFYPLLGLSSLVYIISAYAGIVVAQFDVLYAMLALGMGLFAMTLLVLSSWVTNAVNLYSAALGVNSIIPNVKEWKIILVSGVFGTLAASLNILDQFTDFLFSLSIVFTPVAAVYATDFFLVRKSRPYNIDQIDTLPSVFWIAMISWVVGIATSMLSNGGYIQLTTIEALDSLLVTAPTYLLLTWASSLLKGQSRHDIVS